MAFEIYTAPARVALYYANVFACRRNVDAIGPEHVALGLLLERTGGLQEILSGLGADMLEMIGALERSIPPARDDIQIRHLELTPHVLAILKRTHQLSLEMGHGGVGPAHILLALVEVGDSTAATIFAANGVTAQTLRPRVPAVGRFEVLRSRAAFWLRDRARRWRKGRQG